MGITTAARSHPRFAMPHTDAEFFPKIGGNAILPEPKSIANIANPATTTRLNILIRVTLKRQIHDYIIAETA